MKSLRPAKLHDKDIYVHDFASHLPVLCKELAHHRGPVLELGCGLYSTPVLASHAVKSGHSFVWLVEDTAWADNVWEVLDQEFTPKYREVQYSDVSSLRTFIKRLDMPKYTFVFMDFERPPKERRPVLDVLLEFFYQVLIHDANWVPLEGLNADIDKTLYPWTAVVSR